MTRNPKKSPDDFSKEVYTNVTEKKELLTRQLDVIKQEKLVLEDRIRTSKKACNLREKNHPENALFVTQIEMDRIELDELVKREKILQTEIQEL